MQQSSSQNEQAAGLGRPIEMFNICSLAEQPDAILPSDPPPYDEQQQQQQQQPNQEQQQQQQQQQPSAIDTVQFVSEVVDPEPIESRASQGSAENVAGKSEATEGDDSEVQNESKDTNERDRSQTTEERNRSD